MTELPAPLQLRETRRRDQIFTHSVLGRFNISAMHEALKQREDFGPFLLDIDGQMLGYIRKCNFIDEEHLGKLREIPTTALESPGIVVYEETPPNNLTITLIDGTHRAIILAERGIKTLAVYAIPQEHVAGLQVVATSADQIVTDRQGNFEGFL